MFELDIEACLYLLLNGVAEGGDIGCCGAAAVDEREGVAGRDSSLAHSEVFGKTGLLEEPCGGEFDLAFVGWPVGDFFDWDIQGDGYLGEEILGYDWVLEEGAGAAGVGFAFDDEHAFAVTDATYCVVDVDGRWSEAVEVTLQIGVREIGFSRAVEAERNGGDDVTIAVAGVEDAAPVGEATLFVSEIDKAVGLEVEGADAGDGVCYLLAVGSYVLDGCATDGARDAGEAFDAADSLLADFEDKCVPVGSGSDGVVDGVVGLVHLNRLINGDVQDEAVEAGIADEDIAATPQDEEGKVALAGVVNRFEEGSFGGDLAEEAGWAAYAEGGVGGEGDVLLDSDRGASKTLHGLRVQQPAGWLGGAARVDPVQSKETAI